MKAQDLLKNLLKKKNFVLLKDGGEYIVEPYKDRSDKIALVKGRTELCEGKLGKEGQTLVLVLKGKEDKQVAPHYAEIKRSLGNVDFITKLPDSDKASIQTDTTETAQRQAPAPAVARRTRTQAQSQLEKPNESKVPLRGQQLDELDRFVAQINQLEGRIGDLAMAEHVKKANEVVKKVRAITKKGEGKVRVADLETVRSLVPKLQSLLEKAPKK